MIHTVLRMGDSRLLCRAKEVSTFGTPELESLLTDMRDTMIRMNGAGIAAPQIGVGLRVVIFGVQSCARYPHAEPIPETVLINPAIEPLATDQEDDWEGCLSVPGMRGMVPRYTRLRYSGFDGNGKRIERIAENFHARVVQHECDHLDGILYPMRIRNLARFGFIEELFPDLELPKEA
jgi:peptide deformylase